MEKQDISPRISPPGNENLSVEKIGKRNF